MGEQKRITKKTVLKIVGVLVFLAGMVGIGFLAWLLQNQNNTPRGGLGGYSEAAEKTLPSAAEEAQNLALGGNSAEAEKKLADAIAGTSATNTKEKQQLYIQQALLMVIVAIIKKRLNRTYLPSKRSPILLPATLLPRRMKRLAIKQKRSNTIKKRLRSLIQTTRATT